MDEQDFPLTEAAAAAADRANRGIEPDLDDDGPEPELGSRVLRALADADTWIDSGSGAGYAVRFKRPRE